MTRSAIKEEPAPTLQPDEPEGFGPVLYDDDGQPYRITEDEARNALGPTGGALLLMAAWDFSAHDRWLLDDGRHLYVPPWIRMAVRIAGLALFAAISIVAARDAKQADAEKSLRECNRSPTEPDAEAGP